jgi:hypothetical protein
MKSRDFCYWLQGFFELQGGDTTPPTQQLSATQVAAIKAHLSMVFVHEIDPSFPSDHQEQLGKTHLGFGTGVTSQHNPNLLARC